MVSGRVRISRVVKFGEFEFDLRAFELRRGDRPLKLERIPLQILLLLIERRQELVTRDQIVERVWGKDVFLDTDNSINGAIRKIRQVLRDDPEQPRFVQTVTGLGYRFIADVDKGEIEAPEANSLPVHPPAAPISSEEHRTGLRTAAFLTAVLLFAFVVVAGLWFRSKSSKPGGRLMIAVLPFQNLTGDAKQEYFSDGLTEEMITQLGNLDPQHLGVIARTSVMHYKNSQTSLDQVGRELGVQYVLEGSVRRDDNRVRITAQLVQTKDQTHVWARQYDRELTAIFSLQGEIAREVADEIELTLGDHSSVSASSIPPSPQNYEAYDLYLKGQYFFNKRTPADFQKAIRYFQEATDKDPKYARAYAGLADSYALISSYNGQPPAEFMPEARRAALKALETDESLPEAHAALALIVQNYDWDWQTAEKEYRRAIELNPNYATAHHWYAEHLMWRGRFQEAFQESEKARQLDPLSLIIAADNGAILYFSRQYDLAIEKWNSVRQMDPDFLRAHLIVGAYVQKGMYAAALAESERMRARTPAASYWSWRAFILGRARQTAEAQHAVDELLRISRTNPLDPIVVAHAYAGLEDRDQALAWFEKAYSQHSSELMTLKVNPAYDVLRDDPRFKDLLRRVGLAE